MQCMAFTTRLLRCCGLWPARGDSRLYRLYARAVALNVFLNVVLMSLALVTRNQDMKSFTESGGLILTILPCCFGVVSLTTERRRYQDVIRAIQLFVSDGDSGPADGRRRVAARAAAEEKKMDVLYFGNVVLASFGYHLVPLALFVARWASGDPEARLELPIKQMTLLDCDGGLGFAAEYVAQTVVGCGVIPTLVSLDLLTFLLVKNLAHAFQVLKISLADVGKINVGDPTTQVDQPAPEPDGEGSVFINGAALESRVLGRQPLETSLGTVKEASDTIRKFCQDHQEILRNALELVDLLRKWLFSHYLVASLLVCSLCYQLQVMEDLRDLFTQVSHLTVIMFRLFTLCYFSSELAYQSASVADAACCCDWPGLTAGDKRSLLLVACRAQRPVVMKTGRFGDMSLGTFSAI
ncbi:odorant receptor 67a-like isoform X2 [Bacillus rossius redtenbacheri]|uniref:odorant receptor 67a-like isoform X2 n=1 Tax=Bacillus rossius redtenbacheri TaxID=93214 RepID=UPI002FDD05C4